MHRSTAKWCLAKRKSRSSFIELALPIHLYALETALKAV